MKKLDWLVLSSFVGPYLLSFFVAEFVLTMQLLWKYIDDILGKGFSVLDLLELISYFLVVQIPMALPIAILLSSVMVFGNLSERYELSSFKSAGISLLRTMRPALYLALATAMLSVLASNYLKPAANYKFQKRLRNIRAQKPSLVIEEKIFNKDFKNYAIRVNEKSKEGGEITDVLLYDHTETDKSLLSLTKAKNGLMYTSANNGAFVLELFDGVQYRELKRERVQGGGRKKYPFMRTSFGKWTKSLDMSEFNTEDDNISINRRKEDMLNTFQLLDALDSIATKKETILKEAMDLKLFDDVIDQKQQRNRAKSQDPKINTKHAEAVKKARKIAKKKAYVYEVLMQDTDRLDTVESFVSLISPDDKNNIKTKAVQHSSRIKNRARTSASSYESIDYRRKWYVLRLHQQYSFALICILFLFVGAPLGSIIRKGGYGFPLLFAILFYMVFIIMTIMGEKLLKSGTMQPMLSAWVSNLLVLPVAIYLTVKALRDSKFEGIPIFRMIKSKFSKEDES